VCVTVVNTPSMLFYGIFSCTPFFLKFVVFLWVWVCVVCVYVFGRYFSKRTHAVACCKFLGTERVRRWKL